MSTRFLAFLCGGLIFAVSAPAANAQNATYDPETFKSADGAKAALPRLMKDLKSTDESVRGKAIATLGALGEVAKPAAATLADVAVNQRGHALALQALAKIDETETRNAIRKLLAGGRGRCKCGNTFVEVVAAAGEPIVPHLIAIAAEKEFSGNAESTLVQMGEITVPHLIRNVTDKNEAIRLSMYRVMVQLGQRAKQAAPALEARLMAENGVARLHAAHALCMVTTSHQGAFDILHTALTRNDETERRVALRSLTQMQTRAKILVPAVLNLLLGSDGALWGDASSVLSYIGADAVPALIEALSSKSNNRNYVMYTLRIMGPVAAPAVPNLITVLDGNDQALASIAAECLPALGPEAKKAIPHLLKALKSENATHCRISAQALSRIDAEQIPHTIAPLVALARTSNGIEQGQALWLLHSFGAKAKPAAPALVEMLKTEKLGMRLTVVDVLTRIDPDQVNACLPTLTEALAARKENRSWPNNATRILGQFGPRAKSVGPQLKKILEASLTDSINHPHPSVVAECMKKIGAQELTVQVAIGALASKNAEERNEAFYLILDCAGTVALAPLESAIANGQIQQTAQVTVLLKQLRKRADN